METATPLELTKDMIGEMFVTREGQVVCLEGWLQPVGGDFPVEFSDYNRMLDGKYFDMGADRRDVVQHLQIGRASCRERV